jgi:hypothetical protein
MKAKRSNINGLPKKESKLKYLLEFILSLLLVIGGYYLNEFLNRPKIMGTIDCVDIFNNEDNEFILNLYLKLENSGKSNTYISYDDLIFQFVYLNKSPYSIKLDKKVEIKGLSYINDTLKVILSKEFDTLTINPKIGIIELKYHKVDNHKELSIKKGSSDVIFASILGTVAPPDPNSFSFTPDLVVKNGIAKVVVKNCPVEYKGKVYNCSVFPVEANISYKVVNDKILFKYNIKTEMSTVSNNENTVLFKPIVFYPAPEIADKCILPNKYQVSIRFETLVNNEIQVKDYMVNIYNMLNNKKQLIYFFK